MQLNRDGLFNKPSLWHYIVKEILNYDNQK